MKGRIIATIVLAALLGAVCPAASVTGRGPHFSDLGPEDERYPYVVELARAGILEGRADGSFAPEEPVSRVEVMALLLGALGAEGGTPEELAVSAKLVYTFDGETAELPCTRLEAGQMAARGLGLLPLSGESPYSDCADGYAVKLREAGVWDAGALFRPEDIITRGELAMLLWGMVNTDVSAGRFRYSNYWVEELAGVPLYDYDPACFALTDGRADYTGAGYTVLRGVDVSGYQGDIDWERVKADGMDFAIIRAGGRFMQSGGLYDDSCFEKNVEGALAAGLRVGVYFFSQAITAEEGLEEAQYLLERMAGYDVTMPVIIDWEYLGGGDARTYGVEPEKITDAIAAFCTAVEGAGYDPMVYFNSYCGYIKMDLRRLTDWGFWFAQYTEQPAFHYQFQMWQYTNRGSVDGIGGEADLNLYLIPN